jgi:WD40 repeat protein
MAAMVVQEVANHAFLIDPISGNSTQILPDNAFVHFLGWKPDSQRVMVIKDYLSPWLAGEVDLVTGRYLPFAFPPMEGTPYSIMAVEYSPDGKWMADAIYYHPNSRGGAYGLSIGLWDTQTQARKTIRDIPLAQGIVVNSLVWSPDGNRLFWISRTKTGNDWSDRDVQTELWVSNRTTGETSSIGRLEGVGVKRGWVEWSPDRKTLAVVINEEQEDGFFTGNIFILDPFSGVKTQVSHFNQVSITQIQWSKEGRWIFCNVSDRLSGTIWAVNITSGQAFPVAGPVIANSPFTLIPQY